MKLQKSKNTSCPVLFVVMDGMALGLPNEGNAFHLARTPTLDALFAKPYLQLKAHGTAVGMPSDADMGNSEVGHNAIGAGRVFEQGASLVSAALESNQLFEGAVWKQAIQNSLENHSTLHFIGLLSDGNVHSHESHLHHMIKQASKEGIAKVRVHILLDGRDVSEHSSLQYVEKLESLLSQMNTPQKDYQIASGGGRMVVTMDRYQAEWPMVERGWNAHVLGEARGFSNATEAIQTFKKEKNVNDQYLPAFVIQKEGQSIGSIVDNDSVVFFNFRGDRAIEMCRAFEDDSFPFFDRKRRPHVFFAGMMQYDGDLHIPKNYLVSPPKLDKTISEYLAHSGAKQWACSETQKFGHMTYFWNGNRSGKFDESTETYVEIRSDLQTCDTRPWMKAAEITDATLLAMQEKQADFYRINYPNGDMVGHTGDLEASILACESVDLSLARLLQQAKQQGITVVITADHGNCDQMYELDKQGNFLTDAQGRRKPLTSHTLNPVPFFIVPSDEKASYNLKSQSAFGLSNIAATLLLLLGFEPPQEYDEALIEWTNK